MHKLLELESSAFGGADDFGKKRTSLDLSSGKSFAASSKKDVNKTTDLMGAYLLHDLDLGIAEDDKQKNLMHTFIDHVETK